MPESKPDITASDIIAGIAAGLWVLSITCVAIFWAYSLMTPTKAEREKAAFRCALVSERTDLAIAECYIKHGLEVPDDI